ncbi:MAG: hypothetical protein M1825_000458 [Sarcosagium campestre]|nr:MAG: hypothetical protein M1825_000458 [Sarcosagium campestre]
MTSATDGPSLQLLAELDLASRRPVLTHLNADTTWLMQLPYPADVSPPKDRSYYNILIDPWLSGPQSDVAAWFSQQVHAAESSVRSIAELEDQLRREEGLSEDVSPIDLVVVSHEFTDHCHQDTLLEVKPDTPVYATRKAVALIRSWGHFTNVFDTVAFVGQGADWRTTSVCPLPKWVGISRLAYAGYDLLYFHSAVLVTFDLGSGPEGIVYTPHGVSLEDIQHMPSACPPIRTLALLHGLHDISIAQWQRAQLNLGAHNGLKVQRLLQSKYWIGTHDEEKESRGIVARFLHRKDLTLKDALERERFDTEKSTGETFLADFDESTFHDLGNGQRLVLA